LCAIRIHIVDGEQQQNGYDRFHRKDDPLWECKEVQGLLARKPERKNEQEKKLSKSYWNSRYHTKRKTLAQQVMEQKKELEETKRMFESFQKRFPGTPLMPDC